MSLLKIVITALLSTAIWALANVSQLGAHPFHTTTAEMEYNAQSGRFEVALQVPAIDLEQALTRYMLSEAKSRTAAQTLQGVQPAQRLKPAQGLKPVALDRTPGVERLIVAYLKAHFFLRPSGNDPDKDTNDVAETPNAAASNERPTQSKGLRPNASPVRSVLHWSGMELDRSSAWLYFELEPPVDDKLSLVNDLFFELNAQQINTCTLRTPAAKFSLRTDARTPYLALPPQARLR